jgi:tetratricopeptide (TPR) repeat protein
MSFLSIFGFSGASNAQTIAFSAEHGMGLLQQNRFDESAAYFQKHLKGNAVAYYGLGLTKFRKDTVNLTLSQTKEIIELYEQAIALSPVFADAYFMCGMAYNAAAGFQLGSLNKDRVLRGPDVFREPDGFILKAEQYFRKAIGLNPGFSAIADDEFALNKRLKDFSIKLKAER